MKNLSISAKVTLLLTIVIILSGATLIVFVKIYLTAKLAGELRDKGVSITKNLSADCVDYMLTEDFVSCQHLINRVKELEDDVVYVLILDRENSPVVYTFNEGAPKDLIETVKGTQKQSPVIRRLITEYGYIYDVAVPILDGILGTVHAGLSEKEISATVKRIVFMIILIKCAILLAGALVIRIISKRILSPIMEISKAIKETGKGNFSQKIKIETNDEIGTLAETFNEMAEKLEKTNSELKDTQSHLIQTAKMATIGQFSAGIAHEINNPLAGIMNCVRNLLSDPELKGQKRGYLELTMKGLLRIENTIRQILSFSGRQEFKPRLSNINLLIKDSLEFMTHRIEEQKIMLRQELNDRLPYTTVDPNQLHQVFTNIITNALDAMPSGGTLTINTKNDGENIEITFADTGKGISRDNLEKVFDFFYTTKEVGKGVGLGLSISYALIKQHNGSIDIRSRENEGTTVIVALPVKK